MQDESKGRGRGLRILLVEDVRVYSRLVVLILARAGHEVDVVANGATAVEAARRGSYDVILTEMRLPGLDGLEATRRIRALPGPVAAVPIIAITAQAMQGDERRCLDAGMNDYITKPLDRAMLLGKVAEWGERGRAARDQQASAAGSALAVREQTAPVLRRSPEADRPIESEPSGGGRRAKQATVEPPEHGEQERVTVAPEPARRPGEVFRDVDALWCPELVVIPAGRFLMGSPEDEEGRTDAEGPQHAVTIGAPFALGRYPVTFEEYDTFCGVARWAARWAARRARPPDQGWGRGRRPAINVSWEDGQAYVAWLREQTGQPYRLPSEAEWEYACRAGTTTPFWTGATITTDQANYDGSYTYGLGRKGEYRRQTTPVDRFAANPFGLHDVHGNVFEWVEDRWHGSYEGAPTDGSAWVAGTASARVVRGGSWNYQPWVLRSTCRYRVEPTFRLYLLGFRVARMLTP